MSSTSMDSLNNLSRTTYHSNHMNSNSITVNMELHCVRAVPITTEVMAWLKKALGISKMIDFKHLRHKFTNSTPITGLQASPAQILFSRCIRAKMPITATMMQPVIQEGVQDTLKTRQDKIVTKIGNEKMWEPGVIVAKHSEPRSYGVRKDSEGETSIVPFQEETDGPSESTVSSTRGSVECAKDACTDSEDKVNRKCCVDTDTEDFNFKGFPDCGITATNVAAGGGSKGHYVTRSARRCHSNSSQYEHKGQSTTPATSSLTSQHHVVAPDVVALTNVMAGQSEPITRSDRYSSAGWQTSAKLTAAA
ncbi:hypothetical protein PR048_025635, partial [Dryococelus australis]